MTYFCFPYCPYLIQVCINKNITLLFLFQGSAGLGKRKA